MNWIAFQITLVAFVAIAIVIGLLVLIALVGDALLNWLADRVGTTWTVIIFAGSLILGFSAFMGLITPSWATMSSGSPTNSPTP